MQVLDLDIVVALMDNDVLTEEEKATVAPAPGAPDYEEQEVVASPCVRFK